MARNLDNVFPVKLQEKWCEDKGITDYNQWRSRLIGKLYRHVEKDPYALWKKQKIYLCDVCDEDLLRKHWIPEKSRVIVFVASPSEEESIKSGNKYVADYLKSKKYIN